MVRKAMLAAAIGLGLLGVSGARASAQAIAVRAVVAVPPVVVAAPVFAIGPAPGPGYVWVPAYRRWVFRGYARPSYRVWGRPFPRVYVRGRVWR
jgi:hypothetical protein